MIQRGMNAFVVKDTLFRNEISVYAQCLEKHHNSFGYLMGFYLLRRGVSRCRALYHFWKLTAENW